MSYYGQGIPVQAVNDPLRSQEQISSNTKREQRSESRMPRTALLSTQMLYGYLSTQMLYGYLPFQTAKIRFQAKLSESDSSRMLDLVHCGWPGCPLASSLAGCTTQWRESECQVSTLFDPQGYLSHKKMQPPRTLP